ncbi:MAG TPA: hypothetical protein VFD66_01240 [Verrucomicrobiae bacterium]|nr:hypothetical protein [Verrucomicrobiae bacterium]
MKTRTHPDRSFEFYFPDVDTLLLVENSDDQVWIRATKDTFTERRKLHFLHTLAAEGFVPDRCQWISSFDASWLPVHWAVDASWVRIGEAVSSSSSADVKTGQAGPDF